MKNVLIILMLLFLSISSYAQNGKPPTSLTQSSMALDDKIVKTEAEWKKILDTEQYYVLREQGTEPAFTGKYYNYKGKGIYTCAACGNELFNSNAKYRSGTGWPSFWQPVTETNVDTRPEPTYGFETLEVHCARCDGHLGHIFKDGPQPTGLRYCINSVSLGFEGLKE